MIQVEKNKTHEVPNLLGTDKTICAFGVTTVVIKGKTAYIIKDPAFHITADDVRDELERQGFNVIVLNTGVDYENEEAERLLSECEEQ